MPYPAQIDRELIIQTAIEMLETDGIEQLSLHKLADRLGVKAPSLYRHVGNKTELLKSINRVTWRELLEAMQAVAHNLADDPHEVVMGMMITYRDFAHAHPMVYQLMFLPESQIEPEFAETWGLQVQEAMAELVGEKKSLEALRGAWAMLHGFIVLELGGNFQRVGDVDAAFMQSMNAYLRGWTR